MFGFKPGARVTDSTMYVPHQILSNGDVVDDLSYTITGTPIETAEARLNTSSGEIVSLMKLMMRNPAAAMPKVQELIEKHPDEPSCRSWMVECLTYQNRKAEANELTDRIVEDHPNYLHGKLMKANQLLNEGRPGEVPPLFKNRLGLKQLYPDRSVFHVSEATAFWSILIKYYVAVGNAIQAAFHMDELLLVQPDHPNVRSLSPLVNDLIDRHREQSAKQPPRGFRSGSHAPKKDRNRKHRR